MKSIRGKPELYDEIKASVSIGITKTGLRQLDQLSSLFSLSRSEFIERIGRRIIRVQIETSFLECAKTRPRKHKVYGEVKQRASVALTTTGLQGLDGLAESLNLSRSELVEKVGMGALKVIE